MAIISELGSQGTQPRELLRRKAVQAKTQQGLILIGVHDEFLEFVEDVPVEKSVVGAVDVQGIGSG